MQLITSQAVVFTTVTADFNNPDCEYAGLSCLNCYTQKMCIDFWGLIHWSDTSCANDLAGYISPYCDPTTNVCTSVKPDVCDPISYYKCLRDGLFPDLSSCTVYYLCSGGSSEMFTCDTNYVYNQKYGKCIYAVSGNTCASSPTCGLQNFIQTYPDDPSLYFQCRASSLTFYACEEDQEFDTASSTCVTICNSSGNLPYSRNCSLYYSCDDNEVASLEMCPSGTGFDPSSLSCQNDFQSLCNEFNLLENDVYDFLQIVPFGDVFLPVIRDFLNTLGFHPVTLLVKFGFSDQQVSDGIIIVDYVYKNKKLPPAIVNNFVDNLMSSLPPEIQNIFNILQQLGMLASLARSTELKNTDPLGAYLKHVLLNVEIDPVQMCGSFQGKSRQEINAEIVDGFLRTLDVSERDIPLAKLMLKDNLGLVVNILNSALNAPIFQLADKGEVKINPEVSDILMKFVLSGVQSEMTDVSVAPVLYSYVNELYKSNRSLFVAFLEGFSFSIE